MEFWEFRTLGFVCLYHYINYLFGMGQTLVFFLPHIDQLPEAPRAMTHTGRDDEYPKQLM